MPSPLLGILGGGQLARMLALAAHPLGLRCRVLDPSPQSPAGAVAEHVCADYTDAAALDRFAQDLSAITYEFENVPLACIQHLQARVNPSAPIFPPPQALQTGQDRLLEKQLFRSLGIPVAGFADIGSLDDLRRAAKELGLPAVLKTRRMGYDGKGQIVLRPASSGETTDPLSLAWHSLNLHLARNPSAAPTPLILEAFVPFQAEASILAVRSRAGEIRTYPLVRNEHASGILRRSRAPFAAFADDLAGPAAGPRPAVDPGTLEAQAIRAATRILEALDYVGLLAVEFFVKDGTLIANEIAPRVHNSGHWTIEGSVCSQFENHVRAVCGLPLGDCSMRYPGASASMCNLVGGWPDPADPAGILSIPGVGLHLYGKEPRPGRKVGHATLVGAGGDFAARAARLEALAAASWGA